MGVFDCTSFCAFTLVAQFVCHYRRPGVHCFGWHQAAACHAPQGHLWQRGALLWRSRRELRWRLPLLARTRSGMLFPVCVCSLGNVRSRYAILSLKSACVSAEQCPVQVCLPLCPKPTCLLAWRCPMRHHALILPVSCVMPCSTLQCHLKLLP